MGLFHYAYYIHYEYQHYGNYHDRNINELEIWHFIFCDSRFLSSILFFKIPYSSFKQYLNYESLLPIRRSIP